MAARSLSVAVEKLRMAEPFRISGYVFEHHEVVVVTVEQSGCRGRAEASGVYYLGDDAAHIVAEIERVRSDIEAGADRAELQRLLPPGGARNALDCALWELEAQITGRPVWKLAGLNKPKPLVTTFTIGANAPAKMAEKALEYSQALSIKMKLTGDLEDDIARVMAVRTARPEVWLGVDANQGYNINSIEQLLPSLVKAEVALLEQPLKRGDEAELDSLSSSIPVAADESALCLGDIDALVGRVDIINIKLDKCGGLTEGFLMAHEARTRGLGVMVGNMVGTSLAMAPAYILGQLCEIVDLDGPIFLAEDRTPSLQYRSGKVSCGDDVWGSRAAISA